MKVAGKLQCLLWGMLLLVAKQMHAQQPDSLYTGTAQGVVMDSVHRHVVRTATVAVYTIADSALISYQLTNNWGEFNFISLPVGIPLKMIISYVAYRQRIVEFTISPGNKKAELGKVNLVGEEKELEAVVVRTVVPVRMNKDTLEFNADAFRMNKEAVVEDLLKKLPGIVIWGDGTITFNGRQVSSVLVEGKPFLGGDPKVATQNLPKDAVEKVQVYQQSNNSNNLLDSSTQINVKLKKNKKKGYFGKLSAGYGNDNRKEADATLSFFTPRTQVATAGTGNNTNRVAGSVSSLLRNSTYKGGGVSVENQPNFSMPGETTAYSAGVIVQHDFIPNADYYHNNRLTANYLYNNNQTQIRSNTTTASSLSANDVLYSKDVNSSVLINDSHAATVEYKVSNETRSLAVNGGVTFINNSHHIITAGSIYDSLASLQSTNLANNSGTLHGTTSFVDIHYANRSDKSNMSRFSKTFHIDYKIRTDVKEEQTSQQTSFVSYLYPSENQQINRTYTNQFREYAHTLVTGWDDIGRLIFGYRYAGKWGISLENTLNVTQQHKNEMVDDMDALSSQYITNGYLTNKADYLVLDEMPALSFSRSFTKSLSNRFFQSAVISVTPQGQFYTQQNNSSHSFQHFNHSYQRFVPKMNIALQNNQYGSYLDMCNISFVVAAGYPNVNQLYPLTDSSNLYYLKRGNSLLKPSESHTLAITFQHSSQKNIQAWSYSVNLKMETVANSIVDSTTIYNDGRKVVSAVNANGYRLYNTSVSFNKAFKRKTGEWQLQLNAGILYSQVPNYVNNVYNISANLFDNATVSLYYTHKSSLVLNATQSYNYYRSTQRGFQNSRFSNSSISSSVSAGFSISSRLFANSNVVYNRNTSSLQDEHTHFTLWNAGISYRLFEEKNAELRLAALDLLHQNTNIINMGNNNTITTGTMNVLQQYFMVTLSYFPRQFGKRAKKTEQ